MRLPMLGAATADVVLDDSPLGISFGRLGGPLVAVVGLCGGAGTSTLAHLLATAAARESPAPVLAIDAGTPTGGLAAYAGAQTRESLLGTAARVARDEPVGELFATTNEGLRVIATAPRLDEAAPDDAVRRIFEDARDAHGLAVVDCGCLTDPAGRLALELATHVMWVLPATVSGVLRAERFLAALKHFVPGGEVVCARHDASGRRAPLSELTALADGREAPLALVPHVADYDELRVAERIEQAAVALYAFAGVLRR